MKSSTVWICLFLCRAPVPSRAVGQGICLCYIILSDRTGSFRPSKASVVKKVRVKDGYRVLAGQVMVEVGPTMASADIVSVQEQLKTQASEVLRTFELLKCYQNRSYMPRR